MLRVHRCQALLRSQSQMLTAKIKDSGKKLKEDKGLFVMNLGAILSLTGFMMSDVLYLRLLSVCGSFCGACTVHGPPHGDRPTGMERTGPGVCRQG